MSQVLINQYLAQLDVQVRVTTVSAETARIVDEMKGEGGAAMTEPARLIRAVRQEAGECGGSCLGLRRHAGFTCEAGNTPQVFVNQ